MKVRKIVASLIVIIIAISASMGLLKSNAAEGDLVLNISRKRYKYNYSDRGFEVTNEKYSFGDVNSDGIPINQILSQVSLSDSHITGKNFYCVDQGQSRTWNDALNGTGDAGSDLYTPVVYPKSSSISLNGKTQQDVSQYFTSGNFKQIMWILDNIYVLDTSKTQQQNLDNKRAVLAKSGLVYGIYQEEDYNDDLIDVEQYKYKAVPGYNYSSLVNKGRGGYFYYEDDADEATVVELSDEQIEAVQQAAIWYFTNYKENDHKEKFNAKANLTSWLYLNDVTLANTEKTSTAEVGKMKLEEASIYYSYLIDAAENAAQGTSESTGTPIQLESATRNIDISTLSDKYIVGPIKLKEVNNIAYTVSMTVTGDNSSESYLSNNQGVRLQKDLATLVKNQEEFYVTVPTKCFIDSSVDIQFSVNYNTYEKTLWVNGDEQPIVEVEPKSKTDNIPVKVTLDAEFDLALRKSIVGVTDSKGVAKIMGNESGYTANRTVTYTATDINQNKTATYKHRKDPIVVEKGDIIKYAITVYNEGQKRGYASEIVDQLPEGLILKGYKAGQDATKSGEYKKDATSSSKAVDYTYVYDPETNKITFTNKTPVDLNPYQGGTTLDSITIEIECEVVQEPTAVNNTYLANIAYISKEHDSVSNQEINSNSGPGKDRDSVPGTNTNKNKTNLRTTGEQYDDYKGKESNKTVYEDTTNGNYYEGEQDDDDFEIVVVKPKEFDLALKKYISAINGKSELGRTAPSIDSSVLANGSKETAKYTLDKKAVKVKNGDFITYTFTVYNEGDISGYVNKITDNIPTGLEFVYKKPGNDGKTLLAVDSQGASRDIEVNSEIYQLVDKNSFWSIDEQDERTFAKNNYNGEQTISISCDVASFLGQKTKLNAYDKEKDEATGYIGDGISKVSVSVVLRVSAKDGSGVNIRNEAAITEAEDTEGHKQDQNTGLKDTDSQVNEWPGRDDSKIYQDDEDYDNVELSKLDLALSKFIAAVSGDETISDGEYLTENGSIGSDVNPYLRATKVDTTELKAGTSTDAVYEKDKTPLVVSEGNYVLYDIRVYNEGDLDCYVGQVKDYLPDYLEFVDCDFNKVQNGWVLGEDNKTITTDKLSYAKSNPNVLEAFDRLSDNNKGSGLHYKDLQVLCKVSSNAPKNQNIVNKAEITKYENDKGEDVPEDIDSKPNNKDEQHEDDDDYENVVLENVDLALSKFIAAVSKDQTISDGEYLTANGNVGTKANPYLRATKVDTKELKAGTSTDAVYEKDKTPVVVTPGSYVLYDIRVYNEGEVDCYVGEVKDYLPDYLEFVDCDLNKVQNGWVLGGDNKTITTDKLSYAKSNPNVLKAFNKQTDDGAGSGLDYKDLQVLCKVKDNAPKKQNIVNTAEITKYENDKGGTIPEDKDSTPSNKDEKHEDDDDYENVVIPTIDVALSKFIAAVSNDEDITDGEYLTANGSVGTKTNPYLRATKVDTKELKAGTSTDAIYEKDKTPLSITPGSYVLYDIRVYNEGTVDCYVGEVKDYLPEYLEFVDCDFNKVQNGWVLGEDERTITTDILSYAKSNPNVLKAFNKQTDDGAGSGLDYKDLQVLCKVSENAPKKQNIMNTAEITKYEDEKGTELPEDEDSEPNNKDEEHEDDDDYENIVIPTIDVALSKFIAAVSNDDSITDGEYLTADGSVGTKTNPYLRATKVDTTELKAGTSTDAVYEKDKTPLTITPGSYVLYDIRVYNEGEVDCYVGEVTDFLPEYLEFVDCDFNKVRNGWVLGEDGRTITTDILSYAKANPNVLKAFDKDSDDGAGSGLDYRDLQVLCKISENAPRKQNIMNTAEITKYEDDEGNEIPEDEDSKPDNKDEEHEDDDDYENVVIPNIDVALTKFIAAVSNDEDITDGEYLTADGSVGSKTNPYLRATKVDTTELKAGTSTDAVYEKDKTPLKISKGSYILYDIRVYNEGAVDCYVGEVTDFLPEYLEFVDCDFNKVQNGWVLGEDGRTITTDILSYEKANPNALKAFDKDNDDGAGSGLDYRDLQVLCKISENAQKKQNIVNTAEITKYEDDKGNEVPEDEDSEPDNKDEEHEDDDDYENVVVPNIDLALTKFIAGVSNDVNITDGEYLTADGKVGSKTNPYLRATKVDTTELKAGTATNAKYEKDKTPVVVASESYVLYDIRVYNEGTVDCYAGEVKDYLPDYLDFVNCEFNDNYGWKVEGNGKTITTDILSYEKANPNALKAFDKDNDDGAGSGLDYRDLQVLCKVNKDAPSNHQMVNVSQITKYEDENGTPQDEDEDSKPNNVEFPYDQNQEDDDDYDNIVVQTFDLNLLKYMSTVYVTEDGNTKTIQTGNTGANADIIPKVEINRKKVDSTIVRFGYTIKVTNEGDIEGYAKEITDYVPVGLKFYPEDNEGWTDEGNNVISTRLLENTLLKPGESAEITVILRWINGSDNLGLKTNIAEISEDYNEKGIPDKDSTPDNKVQGEDDMDESQVLLSVSTGIADNIVKYLIFGGIILVVLGTGAILIKRYVI